ncbi:hypothetical protein PENTCL1PPCAC_13033, partial [Pristionchus entomophagus]
TSRTPSRGCGIMFASVIAKWWYGSNSGGAEVQNAAVVEEAKKKKLRVADDDGIFSSEDEEESDEEMMEIRRRFRAAEAHMRAVTGRLDSATLLKMYGLYKVATVGGPDPKERPSFWEQRARAKFLAWEAESKTTKKEAMRSYADILEDAKVDFDPTAHASTSGGFGMRMSRPMMAQEASSGDMNGSAEPTPDEMEWQVWTEAAKNDDVDTIKRILQLNPAIMWKREEDSGLTGLHWAADSGSMSVCAYLLSVQPGMIRDKDEEGNQPLHLAALCGYPDVVELLLQAGASPTLKNYEKESAIDIAATPALKRRLEERAAQIALEHPDQVEEDDDDDDDEDEEEEEMDDEDEEEAEKAQ